MSDNPKSFVDKIRARVDAMAMDDDLARDVAEIVGGGMHARAMSGRGPDGQPWAENSPVTIRRKGHAQVGVGLTGEMLSIGNFTTAYTISGGAVTLHYSGPTEKLGWFEGNNNYGIERPVWGADPTIRADVGDRLRRHCRSALKSK